MGGRNNFSGGIPAGVFQLDQLGMLVLSYNNLCGKIPQNIQLQTLGASTFEETPDLCGVPLNKTCPGDEIAQDPKINCNANGMKDLKKEEDKLISDGFYISMAVGFVFGFWELNTHKILFCMLSDAIWKANNFQKHSLQKTVKFYKELFQIPTKIEVNLRANCEHFIGTKDSISCLKKEREVLLKFKDELIDEYGQLSSWGNQKDKKECCKWRGVLCDNLTNHIIQLDLHNASAPLRGNISVWLLEIQHLKYLDLSFNDFNYSRIPQFIGSLGRLEYLDLSNSYFSGEIPHHLGNLSELQFLGLGTNSNALTSTNLDWLSRIHSLRYLNLRHVNLTMATNWLQTISKLIQLKVLDLSECDLPMVPPPLSSTFNASNSLYHLDLFGNEFSSFWIFHWFVNFSSGLSYIDLGLNKLQGSIPDAIGNLLSLSYLSLIENQLEGEIPVSLGNMSSLSYLDLSSNQLIGIVPHLALSSSLTHLSLDHNMFNGTVTQSIGSLSKLEYLNLGSNHFEDIITESHFFNLSQLELLDLSYNPGISFNFSLGWNPPFHLTDVLLAGCKVGPYFPTWLRTQTILYKLDISNAGILDTFPDWLWELSSNLYDLNVSHNNFHGVLSGLSSKFSTNFPIIDLSFNHFSGSVPILPPTAVVLVLSSNKFSGPITNICNETNCSWYYLDLSNNLLSGQLPDCFANLSNLKFLKLAHNNFFGKFPSLNYLSSLHLQNNSFTGEILTSLRNCTSLAFIDLSRNKLTGKIPTWVGDTFTRLVVLSLRSNEFFGSIPSNLCHLAHLQVLDFSLNKISGAIPKCLNNLTAMIQEVDYEPYGSLFTSVFQVFESANVIWKRNEYEYLNTLQLVKLIDLSSNNLVGDVPAEITSLVMLVGLNLSRNNLSGILPTKIGQLRSLDFLDLSRNHFSGGIPAGVSQLDQLGVLDLSYNNLSGKIPQNIHLRTLGASAFEGNPYLCGLPLKACPGDEIVQDPKRNGNANGMKDPEEEDKLISDGFYITMAVGFVLGFWGVCGTLAFNDSWRIAFFKLWNSSMDWLYIKLAINKIRLKKAFHKFKEMSSQCEENGGINNMNLVLE
ncbi:disease resistance family protein/LRR family protein [Forsythia ovata]|uniref:Disease resistance family protein/LRR family protein n=1 Tax=Forsythia ovata TaxID=205694 RepID=A0ABD1X1K7_9LAMI